MPPSGAPSAGVIDASASVTSGTGGIGRAGATRLHWADESLADQDKWQEREVLAIGMVQDIESAIETTEEEFGDYMT